MPKKNDCVQLKEPMSNIRKAYFARLIGRIIVLCASVAIFILKPESFDILYGFNFFKGFSVFHILWVIWVIDMIYQLVPVKHHIPLGSQKLFRQRFKPIREKINYKKVREHVVSTTMAAYKVFVIWALLIAVIGLLHHFGILSSAHLLIISIVFYVCDLICVLIWCPFRLIMKNRCCTTCRIFNWDHLMMFTPMLFILGFYSISLLVLAFAVWLVWEIFVMVYPERFWEESNVALKCSECTDKLCTQYCRKLRPNKK